MTRNDRTGPNLFRGISLEVVMIVLVLLAGIAFNAESVTRTAAGGFSEPVHAANEMDLNVEAGRTAQIGDPPASARR